MYDRREILTATADVMSEDETTMVGLDISYQWRSMMLKNPEVYIIDVTRTDNPGVAIHPDDLYDAVMGQFKSADINFCDNWNQTEKK